jgi:hypothetical protein
LFWGGRQTGDGIRRDCLSHEVAQNVNIVHVRGLMKLPWDKWFFEDLDTDCGPLSLAARGAWVWIIGNLRNHDGERSLTLDGWSRVVRATAEQTAIVLSELIASGTCDSNIPRGSDLSAGQTGVFAGSACDVESNVTRDAMSQKGDALIVIRCRRIARECKVRKLHRLRQQRYRSRDSRDASGDADVTPIELEAEAEAEADTEKREANSASPPAVRRRSRSVPSDFSVSGEMNQWAVKLRPDLDIGLETEKFKDYEFKDPKSDWVKTWRNWIRNARVRNGNANGANSTNGGEKPKAHSAATGAFPRYEPKQ